MKLHEPIGPIAWAAFFIRVSLGYYLLVQGYAYLRRVPEIVEKVKSFNMIPEHLAQLYGSLLPFLAVAAGIMLILGFWTTLAAAISTLMIASIIYAFKEYPTSFRAPPTPSIVLLCSSLSLLFSGSGAMSIDHLRKNAG
jgi:uncharacterized membrane protein YphA (DoxX/SURF4 family)